MTDLTMRSKIAIYWTTNPADLGYDGRPTGGTAGAWKTGKPDAVVGMRQASRWVGDVLRQKIGTGTYYAISYQHGGREISLSEIEAIVLDADYALNHQ